MMSLSDLGRSKVPSNGACCVAFLVRSDGHGQNGWKELEGPYGLSHFTVITWPQSPTLFRIEPKSGMCNRFFFSGTKDTKHFLF